MSSLERDYKWDNYKAFLIFLVVTGHFLIRIRGMYPEEGHVQAFYLWIYTFHMPAFVFASGYLAGKYQKNQTDYNRLVGLLVLYVLFKGAYWIENTIEAGRPLPFHVFSESAAPWYLMCLFWWYLLLPFFRGLSKTSALTVGVLCSILVGFETEANSFLSLSKMLSFLPFFIGGVYFNQKNERIGKGANLARKTGCAVILFASLIVFFKKTSFLRRFELIVYGDKCYEAMNITSAQGIIIKIGWMMVASALIYCALQLMPQGRTCISSIGKNSLGIYVFHILLRPLILGYAINNVFIENEDVVIVEALIISALVVVVLQWQMLTDMLNRILRYNYLKNAV